MPTFFPLFRERTTAVFSSFREDIIRRNPARFRFGNSCSAGFEKPGLPDRPDLSVHRFFDCFFIEEVDFHAGVDDDLLRDDAA